MSQLGRGLGHVQEREVQAGAAAQGGKASEHAVVGVEFLDNFFHPLSGDGAFFFILREEGAEGFICHHVKAAA